MIRPYLGVALAAALAFGSAPAGTAFAQNAEASASQASPATLVADRVKITGDNLLIAEGSVEALWEGTRLKAQRIVYDRTNDRLTVEGPITVVDEAGVILTADAADLTTDLREGLLISARMVLDQQLQLAANRITRTGGRYTELSQTIASSCQVCASNPTPLWEIRAARVLHDQQERQLYFDRAQFRIMGVPVAYIPRLRLPDPTLDRSTGLLLPQFRTTSTLGYGIMQPYFIALGDHADLTLTPYISTGRTFSLGWRYRQAVRRGRFSFKGAVSRDDLMPDRTRGYIFGEGRFDLPDNFVLSFGLQTVTDSAYLQDYAVTDADRLVNHLTVERVRRDEYISARVLGFRTLREGETNAEQPTTVIDVTHHRRFDLWGGIGGTRLQAHAHYRPSDEDVVGRDVARASGQFEWQRSWILSNGIATTASGEMTFDHYGIRQDSTLDSQISRVTPAAGVEFRWPWSRQGADGVVHVLEPVAQLVASRSPRGGFPDEDSVLVEFDEGNLFALNRFPGWDRRETGLRANLGLHYSRLDPLGWQLGVTVGRVYRESGFDQFPPGSGLGGAQSDWLVVADLTNFSLRGTGMISLTNRALFDTDLRFSQNELRVGYDAGRLDLASSYLWQASDVTQGREAETSEWVMDASWRVTANWQASADWRYDFAADRAARASFGLGYRNECVTVDLSLSRRFTSSTSVRPTTFFGLSVDLIGFGTGTAGAPRRACAR